MSNILEPPLAVCKSQVTVERMANSNSGLLYNFPVL